MSNTLLKVENVEVSYGNIKALRGVSIEINTGDIVSLIGANGAGKSTLLKAIVGEEELKGGKIDFNGETLFEFKNNHHHGIAAYNVIRKGIALVPEGRRVFGDLTVEENLDMGAFTIKNDAYIKRKKEEMFSFFPILSERRKQRSRSLSGGEQQMLAVARALMVDPRLLLLDEPGLGLAPLIVQEIFSKLRLINSENGVTIFVVEQNAKLALSNSKKGYVMENGKITLSDDAHLLLKNEMVRKAYLGE